VRARARHSPTPVRRNLAALALLVALMPGCSAGRGSSETAPRGTVAAQAAKPEPSAQERIRYYSERIAESPRLYPMYTQLGIALLDRTKETHDPTLLAKAREAEATALAIQDNFESLLAMAAIQNYSHRFEDAIRWGRRAADASVGGDAARDPAVTALLVEACLGFGKLEEAAGLVPRSVEEADDFHAAASLGRWLAEAGRADEAEKAYSRAAELARREDAPALAAWAETAAAGALIDSGRAAEATAHLEAAARLAPTTTFLLLHRAEAAQATGRSAEATAILEEILRHDPDPAVEALAFVAARKAGDGAAAERHFRAAQQGFQRAIEAGEVHTLGALAKLYLDADRNLDSALALARENLQWKRDRAAAETLAALEAQRR